VPTDAGFVLHDVWLLRMRALLAECRGDQAAYLQWVDRYRDGASSFGFAGHVAMADQMT
jgi:adenylate cyclase